MSHLERCTIFDLAYIVHLCERFSSAPKLIHTKAVKWIGRYLLGTKDKGYVINPDLTKGLELYVDSDWSGNWNFKESEDSDTARSRYGFIMMFAGVPIFWASRLQTLIALSSTEAEYIGLSEALREIIPIIELIKELQEAGFDIPTSNAKVLCKVFEDNAGAIEMAKDDKFRPQTKHINVKFHHFCDYVEKGVIDIEYIKSEENPADILTHPVNLDKLQKHLTTLLKWHLLPQFRRGVKKPESPEHEGRLAGANGPKLERSAPKQESAAPASKLDRTRSKGTTIPR